MSRRTLSHFTHATAFLCLWSLAAPLDAAHSGQQSVAAHFETYFQQHVAAEKLTGAAFVVASPEGIVDVGTAGYTDTRHTRRIDENTVFRIASVSKTFAAGLAGLLVREGQFRWDDRVVDYLPDFRVNGDSGEVRIQDLLGQSTGLIPHAYDNLIEDGLALDQIQPRFHDLSYICHPGTCYSYQNSVFSLIGPIMEATSSQPYATLMERRIFRPLDMQTASVGYEAFTVNPNRALPHVKSREQWKTISVQPNYYRVAPAAGVNASILDMGKWLVAQMGGQPGVFDKTVIDTLTEPRVRTVRDTRRAFWRELLSDAYYGLGWRIYRMGDHEIAYHSGWVSGYRADIAWSGEYQVGIVVLMNAECNCINELTTTFWRMAFEQLRPSPRQDSTRLAKVGMPGRPAGAASVQ
jgi:beta-lactamase class C